MGKLQTWFSQLQWMNLLNIALMALMSLLCITVHETCHGLAAYALGDPTAKRAGRLSLNPLRHVDILGLIMMAIFHFGWAKPVPIDPRNFKHPRRDMALTAVAGPLANLVFAWAATLVCGLIDLLPSTGGVLVTCLQYVSGFLSITAWLSVGLAVFNLLPIPPLDGSKVLLAFLPAKISSFILRYERVGMLLLCAILYFGWLDGILATMDRETVRWIAISSGRVVDWLQKIFS